MILAIIGKLGTAGGTGYVIEYAGRAIREMTMEGRMTVCNMSIEAGARAGLIAPDETTFKYLARPAVRAQGRRLGPGARRSGAACRPTRARIFDTQLDLAAADIPPMVTWGTSPQDALPITDVIPDPANAPDENRREAWTRSLAYMGLTPGTKLVDVPIDRVFIGSCTNGRIEDLRAAAEIARGRKVAPSVSAMVVPGSGLVKAEAEKEGLDKIFLEAGFEWRIQGCSMCLAMNADRLEPGPALRLDLEPQLRGPPGPRRPHPSGQPGDGGSRRDQGHPGRRARLPVVRPTTAAVYLLGRCTMRRPNDLGRTCAGTLVVKTREAA